MMTPVTLTDAILLALIPALVFLLLAFWLWHGKEHKPHGLKSVRDEAVMGQHLRDAKRRTTVHTIVNSMAGEAQPVKAMFSFIQREEFPDVSFYQGLIDWEKMATKTRKVIIRAGQRNWVDTKFVINWIASRLFGLQRGCYWFFDGRESPGSQAKLLVSLIKDDKPELGVWIDWERNYGGSHEGIKNVVAMMQEVERLLPGVEVGMYTGYWFFRENSNPIWNAAQYAYLAKKKLWLAFYAALEKVLIPAPWLKMKYWQKGTPAVGREHGCETEELDMNEDMAGGAVEPQPEPETGVIMKGVVKAGYVLKVRDDEAVDSGMKLFGGDTVYGEVRDNRIYHDEIFRANGSRQDLNNEYNSAVRDAGIEFMTLTNEADPAPDPSPAFSFRLVQLDVTATIENTQTGERYKAEYTHAGLNLEFVQQ